MLQSEWDPILTPSMHEYALVRQVDSILQIKLGSGYIINLDARCIPQLHKILARLDNKLEKTSKIRYNKVLERH